MTKIEWKRGDDGKYRSVAGIAWKSGAGRWCYQPSKYRSLCFNRWAETLAEAKDECRAHYRLWEREHGPLPPMADMIQQFANEWRQYAGQIYRSHHQMIVADALVQCMTRLATDETGEVAKALERWWRKV